MESWLTGAKEAEMKRRDFFRQAGIGSAALVSLPGLAHALTRHERGDDDDDERAGFDFVCNPIDRRSTTSAVSIRDLAAQSSTKSSERTGGRVMANTGPRLHLQCAKVNSRRFEGRPTLISARSVSGQIVTSALTRERGR
jgi:hypothetical protein